MGSGNTPLPPELNPRGRRAGRQEQRAAAARRAAAGGGSGAGGSGVGGGSGSGRPPARRGSRGRRAAGGSEFASGALLGTKILAAVVSVAIVVASGWLWYTWNNFTTNLHRVNAITAPSTGTVTKGGKTTTAVGDPDGKDQNILIVGNDDRDSATDAELAQLGTTRDGGSYNTDTMMLMHLPADGKKATIVSFPRDSYVAIPGHDMNKLNAAYPEGISDDNGNKSGGAQLLVQTIQNLTGLHIDHFVQVDLLGFYRISNAIGGIQVNMCQAVQESNSGINLHAGINTIEGTQALAFVRQRYGLPNGDLDRIKRQQYFLSAVFRKLASAGVLLNPIKQKNLLNAVSKSLSVDETLNPAKLAEQMTALTAGNLNFSTIPTDGFADEGVGSVVVVHPEDVQADVQKLFKADESAPKPTAKPTTKAIPASSITVSVLNGAGEQGVAATNLAALKALGFKTGTAGDAPATTPTTTVEFPAGQSAQAAVVAAKLPGAAVKQTSGISTITVVLGTDGIRVGGAQSSTPSSGTGSTPPPVTNAAENTGCIN
jgi:LCP family protein required for cell wall assembly